MIILLNDYSGQDIDSPDTPIVNSFNIYSDNKIRFNMGDIEDNGTIYNYYIEAIGQDDNTIKESNIVTTEIKSGIKGYSYVLDYEEDTVPDNKIDSLYGNEYIEMNFTPGANKPMYLHINAVDNTGNISETLHFKISDDINPEIEINISDNEITNGEVAVTINAYDDLCLDYILLPNGQKIYSDSVTYSVRTDGEYEFVVFDKFGNSTRKVISISNIDTSKPIINIDVSGIDAGWVNKPIDIIINVSD